ncbi:MAG: hypothetical protein PF549_02220 [Patescibacteria group bacterium]|jgi:hypothetical protein|nr:hypothetical protein [Patescibacteria group bacterium]
MTNHGGKRVGAGRKYKEGANPPSLAVRWSDSDKAIISSLAVELGVSRTAIIRTALLCYYFDMKWTEKPSSINDGI